MGRNDRYESGQHAWHGARRLWAALGAILALLALPLLRAHAQPCGAIGGCGVDLLYETPTGNLTLVFNQAASTLEIQSQRGLFAGPRPQQLAGMFDMYSPHKIFWLTPNGTSGLQDFGRSMRPNMSCQQLAGDLSVRASGFPSGSLSVGLANLCDGPEPADVNEDRTVDVRDVDAFIARLRSGAAADVDASGATNADDLDYLITWMMEKPVGDANWDGHFGSDDLVAVMQPGEYEDSVGGNSTWADGDWTGDLEFDANDLIKAFQSGAYEVASPTNAINVVPEPSAALLTLLGLLIVSCRSVRRGATRV